MPSHSFSIPEWKHFVQMSPNWKKETEHKSQFRASYCSLALQVFWSAIFQQQMKPVGVCRLSNPLRHVSRGVLRWKIEPVSLHTLPPDGTWLELVHSIRNLWRTTNLLPTQDWITTQCSSQYILITSLYYRDVSDSLLGKQCNHDILWGKVLRNTLGKTNYK